MGCCSHFLTLTAIAVFLGYFLELDGNTVGLETPLTQVTGHVDIKLVLTWKLYPCWLAFIVLEGSMCIARGSSLTVFLPICEYWEVQ